MADNQQITTSGFGGHKTHNSSNPVGYGTFSGYSTSPWGMNDNVRVTIDGGSGTGILGAAIALVQAYFAFEQVQLAEKYYDTNKQEFDFFKNNYQSRMQSHKNQAFTTPFYTLDYNPMTGASLTRTKVYDEKWFQTRRRLPRYSLGQQRHVDYQFYMLRRKAAFSAYFTGRRVEQGRKDRYDEQIQTHKIQALNFGIAAGNIARQGLASAVETKMRATDELGSRIGGLANGLSRFSGYASGFNNASDKMAQVGVNQ